MYIYIYLLRYIPDVPNDSISMYRIEKYNCGVTFFSNLIISFLSVLQQQTYWIMVYH